MYQKRDLTLVDGQAAAEPPAPSSQAPAVVSAPDADPLPPEVRKVLGSPRVGKGRSVSVIGKTNRRPEEVLVREQIKKMCHGVFFREDQPHRSLGFTSAIPGEGKSYLASFAAALLAEESGEQVILVDCNWERPSLHDYFDLPATPGLAEWLRGECDLTDISHAASNRLTVIPAGNGTRDAVKLLRRLRQVGLEKSLAQNEELLVVDLPPVATCSFGQLAASTVDALVMVVLSGVTPDYLISQTCDELRDLPVHGLLLNQVRSRIPRWLSPLL